MALNAMPRQQTLQSVALGGTRHSRHLGDLTVSMPEDALFVHAARRNRPALPEAARGTKQAVSHATWLHDPPSEETMAITGLLIEWAKGNFRIYGYSPRLPFPQKEDHRL